MKLLFLSFLLLISCKPTPELSREAMGARLDKLELEVKSLKEIKWLVGKKLEAEVTQSLVMQVDLPSLDESQLKLLQEYSKSDSWIVRVILERGRERQDLGALYAPFHPKSHYARGSNSSSTPSTVAIRIFYAAAFASERFRAMKCPPFGHDKRVTDFQISGKTQPQSLILNLSRSYPEKVQLVDLTPSSFNGGHTLVGNYFFEIAGYDSRTKTIQSEFLRLPENVSIKSEESQSIPTCHDQIIELKN